MRHSIVAIWPPLVKCLGHTPKYERVCDMSPRVEQNVRGNRSWSRTSWVRHATTNEETWVRHAATKEESARPERSTLHALRHDAIFSPLLARRGDIHDPYSLALYQTRFMLQNHQHHATPFVRPLTLI